MCREEENNTHTPKGYICFKKQHQTLHYTMVYSVCCIVCVKCYLSRAGEGATGADAAQQDVDLAVCLVPDLRTSGLSGGGWASIVSLV